MVLSRYISRTLLANFALALFVLVAIYSFFSLVYQLDDTGVGSYNTAQAMLYVLLTLPGLGYDLFPIAAVIGSMVTLGLLANSRELVIIRAAGVSQQKLAYYLLKPGLVLFALNLILGELVIPISETAAKQQRSMATTQQISLDQFKNGFWSRDGNQYINIGKLLPGDRVEDIYIYELDDNQQLISSTRAGYGQYSDGRWRLHDIEKTVIAEAQVTVANITAVDWQVLLNPDLINLVTVEPDYLSIYGLIRYIRYLKENNRSNQFYEQALWAKIIAPFTIITMILLAVCVVKTHARLISMSRRVFIGTLIGIIFHLATEVSGHLSIVYGVPAVIGAVLPTLLVLGYIVYFLAMAR